MPHIIGGQKITADYNTIYETDDDDKNRGKVEMWIAKAIGDTLVANYPNRQWGVHVDTEGRMVAITCPSLSDTHGWHISMEGKTLTELQEKAKMAGGEIMERYGLSRQRVFNPEHIESLGKDVMGNAVGPDSRGVEPIKRGR